VPGLSDEHGASAVTAEHAVDGIDSTLHNDCYVSVECGLAQPLQARPQRLFVNMHRYHLVSA
jgi:hypothetical protein